MTQLGWHTLMTHIALFMHRWKQKKNSHQSVDSPLPEGHFICVPSEKARHV